MPVLARFNGIVVRLLMAPIFGVRLHAFYGNAEVVLGVNPGRIITSDVPAWVEAWVLGWVREHQHEFRLPPGWRPRVVASFSPRTSPNPCR